MEVYDESKFSDDGFYGVSGCSCNHSRCSSNVEDDFLTVDIDAVGIDSQFFNAVGIGSQLLDAVGIDFQPFNAVGIDFQPIDSIGIDAFHSMIFIDSDDGPGGEDTFRSSWQAG